MDFKIIEQIPADELIVMTPEMHRLFNAAGCNPACHGCWHKLPPDTSFKLSTVMKSIDGSKVSREVMLCEKCTPDMVNEETERRIREAHRIEMERLEYKKAHPGCYRVNGKIVS